MQFGRGTNRFRPRPISVPFFLRPNAKVENRIDAKREKACCDLPIKILYPGAKRLVVGVKTKGREPFVRREADCAAFDFELLRERRFAGAGKAHHEDEG